MCLDARKKFNINNKVNTIKEAKYHRTNFSKVILEISNVYFYIKSVLKIESNYYYDEIWN